MKQITLISIFILCSYYLNAQNVGINTTGAAPHASAMLDVVSTSAGVLVPRMTAAQKAAIGSPATGLLIYQTDGVAGFYYYSGSAWVSIGSTTGWSITGNSSTVDGTNFIGTTDNIPFNIRVNNQKAGRIESSAVNGDAFYGYQAGNNNTSGAGVHNNAVGYQALTSNTTGDYNTAIGNYTLYSNVAKSRNTAVGYNAMYYADDNGAAANTENTAIGYNALKGSSTASNNTGTYNTAAGGRVLEANTSGGYNSGMGALSLWVNTTGSWNAALGYSALPSNTTGDFNVAIGATSLNNNTTGSSNIAIGASALSSNKANRYSIAIGEEAMTYADDRVVGRITYNIGIGYQALRGSTTAANNTGQYNNAIGYQALLSNTSGYYNNAIGYEALKANTSGFQNVALGYQALKAETTGNSTVAVGTYTLLNQNGGGNNTAVGHDVMNSCTSCGNNTAVGLWALRSNSTQWNNTAIGASSLYNATGGNNIGIGYQAGDNLTTGTNNLIIGYDIDAPVATSSNQMSIGNIIYGTGVDGTGASISSGNIGIGDASPDHKLDVAGNIGMNASSYLNFGDTDGTTGYGIRDNAGTVEYKNSGGAWSSFSGLTVGYTLQAFAYDFNPADATTYYFGANPTYPPTTASATYRIYIPKAGTIKACYVSYLNIGTGSAEASQVVLNKNNTTDIYISNTVANNSANTVVSNTGMSAAVAQGDYLQVKWTAPTWATNPSNVNINVTIYIE